MYKKEEITYKYNKKITKNYSVLLILIKCVGCRLHFLCLNALAPKSFTNTHYEF